MIIVERGAAYALRRKSNRKEADGEGVEWAILRLRIQGLAQGWEGVEA